MPTTLGPHSINALPSIGSKNGLATFDCGKCIEKIASPMVQQGGLPAPLKTDRLTKHRVWASEMHMHHSATPLEDLACAGNALRQASRAVTRLYDEILDGTGLTLAQFAMLRNIARHEPLALMQLAHALVMDRTTLYRALKPLHRAGLVVIEDGAGRAKAVRLTDKGHQAVAEAKGAWHEAQQRLLGRFGPERWNMVQAALKDLVTLSQEEMR